MLEPSGSRSLRRTEEAGFTASMTSASDTLAFALPPVGPAPVQPATIILVQAIGSRVSLPFSGRVHSVYRQACNIETEHGTLVTLLSQGVGNLPHGIRCILPEPVDFRAQCSGGQTVVADGACLRIPRAGMALHLSGATTWRCALAACVVDAGATRTLRLLLDVRATLREHAPASGFAPLLLRDGEPGSPLDRAMQRRLRQTLPVLDRATWSLDADSAMQALGQLVGLGPGLTPSGDDFIVGYLAALWSRSSLEPAVRSFLAELAEPIERLAAGTHLISRQFLLNAVVGEFSEPLAELVSAMAVNDAPRVLAGATRVVLIGHSSGADSLVGLLFGLRPSLLVGSACADGRSRVGPALR